MDWVAVRYPVCSPHLEIRCHCFAGAGVVAAVEGQQLRLSVDLFTLIYLRTRQGTG